MIAVRIWVLSAFLAGLLVLGAGAGIAQTQKPAPTTEPQPGTKADIREDQSEAAALRAKIQNDREKLRADIQQFGKNSNVVKEDRMQLRKDLLALRKLRRDVNRDRRLMAMERREERREHIRRRR